MYYAWMVGIPVRRDRFEKYIKDWLLKQITYPDSYIDKNHADIQKILLEILSSIFLPVIREFIQTTSEKIVEVVW